MRYSKEVESITPTTTFLNISLDRPTVGQTPETLLGLWLKVTPVLGRPLSLRCPSDPSETIHLT